MGASMGVEASLLQILTVIVMSYLLGSMPTAYLVGKLHNINIFEVGSGNMGGTNTARALGMRWGVVVVLLDALKGILAVLVARTLMPDAKWAATTISSIVVIVGHNWSLFATLLYWAARKGGKLTILGGKGAATALGTMLMIAPVQIIVGMVALFFTLVLATRYVSLAVLAAYALAIAWLVVLAMQQIAPIEYVAYALLLAVLLVLRFKGNIQRLLSGTERRLGEPA